MTLYVVHILTRLVTEVLVLLGRSPEHGSFAAMLLLETFLEHGQIAFLFIALLFDDRFTAHVSEMVPRVCPSLVRANTFLSEYDACDILDESEAISFRVRPTLSGVTSQTSRLTSLHRSNNGSA